MRTYLYINYSKNPHTSQQLSYNLPSGWIEQGVGYTLIPQITSSNNPITLNEDNSFIGPKETVNEIISYMNDKFSELKTNGSILDYELKLYYTQLSNNNIRSKL